MRGAPSSSALDLIAIGLKEGWPVSAVGKGCRRDAAPRLISCCLDLSSSAEDGRDPVPTALDREVAGTNAGEESLVDKAAAKGGWTGPAAGLAAPLDVRGRPITAAAAAADAAAAAAAPLKLDVVFAAPTLSPCGGNVMGVGTRAPTTTADGASDTHELANFEIGGCMRLDCIWLDRR